MGPKNSLGRSLSERRDARGVLNTYPFGFQKKGFPSPTKKNILVFHHQFPGRAFDTQLAQNKQIKNNWFSTKVSYGYMCL